MEKTGLCSQITFGRYVRQGRRLRLDPKLFIQDLQFNEVPVRVYQPKAVSHRQRRAIIFFHGGGWVFGSLGKIRAGGIIIMYKERSHVFIKLKREEV